MKVVDAVERWLLVTVSVGIFAFFAADERPLTGAVALLLALAGRALVAPGALTGRAPAPAPGSPTQQARLPRWLINAMALAAVAYAALTALENPEDFVTSLGALLAWIQVIRLFDFIGPRDRGQLLVMSLFTAVAALLTSNSLIVGLCLAVYLPAALWTIFLQQIDLGRHEAVRAGGRPAYTPQAPRDLRRVTGVVFVFCVAVATVCFLVLPRNVGADMLGNWSAPSAGAETAFTDEVVLGRDGEISESQETVMDVVVANRDGQTIGSVDVPILLRGAALDEYDAQRGVWRRSELSARNSQVFRIGPFSAQAITPASRRDNDLLSYRITVRNKQNEHLFTVLRPVSIALDRATEIRVGRQDLSLSTDRRGRITYTVQSQRDFAPIPELSRARMPLIFQEGRIRELALQILAEGREPLSRDPQADSTPQDLQIARRIESHFRTGYAYTLQMTPPEPGEDPIEMFLFRIRRGHCEYFASAMVALLRSLGIDARVVTGYRTDEFNEFAGHYTVRQMHAHSWVEARVDEGLWVTFDPSPSDGVAATQQRPTGLRAMLRQAVDAAEHAWVNWVIGFDDRMRTSLFGETNLGLGDVARRAREMARLDSTQLLERVLRAAIVGVAAFAVAAALGYGAQAALAAARRRSRRPRAAHDGPDAAERERQGAFYPRLLARLRRAGLPKPAWRPPAAHAQALDAERPGLAADVRRLADLYYVLRFGARTLNPEEQAEVQARMASVDAALAERRAARR